MKLRPDMTVKEVPPPQNHFCRSGHSAPEVFAPDPKKPSMPTRFFSVSCDADHRIDGTYCEPCLIVSNAIARGEIEIRRR
jgi:hypothetical protein